LDGELEAAIELIDQAADLHKIVLLKAAEILADVVPHFRVNVAGAVREGQRQVKLAALFGLSLFG